MLGWKWELEVSSTESGIAPKSVLDKSIVPQIQQRMPGFPLK